MKQEKIKEFYRLHKGIPSPRHMQIVKIIKKLTKDKKSEEKHTDYPEAEEIISHSDLTKNSVYSALNEMHIRGWIIRTKSRKTHRNMYYTSDKWYKVLDVISSEEFTSLVDYPTRKYIKIVNIIKQLIESKRKEGCKIVYPDAREITSYSGMSKRYVIGVLNDLCEKEWIETKKNPLNNLDIYFETEKWNNIVGVVESRKYEDILGNPSRDNSIKCEKCGEITVSLYKFQGKRICQSCFCPPYERTLEQHVYKHSSCCYDNF